MYIWCSTNISRGFSCLSSKHILEFLMWEYYFFPRSQSNILCLGKYTLPSYIFVALPPRLWRLMWNVVLQELKADTGQHPWHHHCSSTYPPTCWFPKPGLRICAPTWFMWPAQDRNPEIMRDHNAPNSCCALAGENKMFCFFWDTCRAW